MSSKGCEELSFIWSCYSYLDRLIRNTYSCSLTVEVNTDVVLYIIYKVKIVLKDRE